MTHCRTPTRARPCCRVTEIRRKAGKVSVNIGSFQVSGRQVGRPTKYNEELQAHADRYIFDYHEQEDVIPSAAGLCVWLGISRPTLHEWERIHPEFSNTLSAIRELQEKVALNKGLTGAFNSTIVKLVLANH